MEIENENGEIGSLVTERHGSGAASWAEHSWHQTGVNQYPKAFTDSVDSIIEHAIHGWVPPNHLLNVDSNIVTLGSCFAAELRHFLDKVGLSSNSFWVPSGLNNTFALLDFVSWCITGKETGKGFGYARSSEGNIEDWTPTWEREKYLDKFLSAGAFVFTLGLSEVWEDTHTNNVFWRGIPKAIFQENRHIFRLSTVEENKINLRAIIDLIRTINPIAPIVITLSPVPLKATFQKHSCMTADCVSKSILRLAIDSVMSTQLPHVYYWPSFEIVKWGGCHLPYPVYGTDDNVVRHVSRYLVVQILYNFVQYFYGEVVFRDIKAKYDKMIDTENGNPGQPPILIRGTIVKA